ncbi:proteasome subunit beta [Candidatus Woesearchaeota archaeon]|nr:proteasome subunit beta [Candidatus Woesearchaeota archaeon]
MAENLKTGTTTIAIKCKNGIVLGADKRATVGEGGFIVNKDVTKIHKISDNMVLTMAGSVSDVQLLIKYIKAELRLKKVRSMRDMTVKEAANLLAGMVYSNVRRLSIIPGVSHFLLAGKDGKGLHLFDIFPDGSITEIKDYVSSGSGSVMAYGVLETLYASSLTMEEGVKIVVKSLNAAIQRDTASGSGFDIVTVSDKGIKEVVSKKIETKVEA